MRPWAEAFLLTASGTPQLLTCLRGGRGLGEPQHWAPARGTPSVRSGKRATRPGTPHACASCQPRPLTCAPPAPTCFPPRPHLAHPPGAAAPMHVLCVTPTPPRPALGPCRISAVLPMEKLPEGGGLDKLPGSGALHLPAPSSQPGSWVGAQLKWSSSHFPGLSPAPTQCVLHSPVHP